MPLFGGRKKENEKLRVEIDRMIALPLTELAEEIMTRGFGPGGPAGEGRYAELSSIAGALHPARGPFLDDALLVQHFRVVAEGAQLLEHAGLVRFEVYSSGGIAHWNWTATRSGQAALQQNAIRHMLEQLSPQPAEPDAHAEQLTPHPAESGARPESAVPQPIEPGARAESAAPQPT